LKILFIAPRFHTNQIGVVKALLEAGHVVRFLTIIRGKTEDHRYLTPDLLPLTSFSRRLKSGLDTRSDLLWPTLWGVPQLHWLRDYVRGICPDAVIIRNPNKVPFFLSLILIRLMGYPVVVYTQGPKRRPKTWLSRLAFSFFLDLLNCAWITPILGNPCDPPSHPCVHYLPSVVEIPPSVEQRSYTPGGLIRLISIGKFITRKNHLLLLEAFALLAKPRPIHLTIVGEVSSLDHRSHLEQVERRLLKLGLSTKVTVLTNVPFESMSDLYLNHDAFVIPSSKERLSVSLVEAMAHGLAVVASTSNAAAGYIQVGWNGYIFREDDVEDLREKLAKLTSSPQVIEVMGRRSFLLARKYHDCKTYPTLLIEAIASTRARESERLRP